MKKIIALILALVAIEAWGVDNAYLWKMTPENERLAFFAGIKSGFVSMTYFLSLNHEDSKALEFAQRAAKLDFPTFIIFMDHQYEKPENREVPFEVIGSSVMGVWYNMSAKR